MALIPPVEIGRRARAAMVYAGIDYAELAERTGIKDGTLRNITSTTRPSGGSPVRRRKIAIACGVPLAFMEAGFAPMADPISDVELRLHQLEMNYEALLSRLPQPDESFEQALQDASEQDQQQDDDSEEDEPGQSETG